MDEIDAALDFRNVSIVANYIKDRTKCVSFWSFSICRRSPDFSRSTGTPSLSSSRSVT